MISTAVVNHVLYTNCCHKHWTQTLRLFYSFFTLNAIYCRIHCINRTFAATQNKPLLSLLSRGPCKLLQLTYHCLHSHGAGTTLRLPARNSE